MDNVICSEVIKHFVDASEITKFLEHGRGNLTTLQYEEKLAQLRNKYTEREKFILNKTLTFTASIIDVDANRIKVLIPDSCVVPLSGVYPSYNDMPTWRHIVKRSIFANFRLKHDNKKQLMLNFNIGDVVKLKGEIVKLIGAGREPYSGSLTTDSKIDEIYFYIDLDLLSIELVKNYANIEISIRKYVESASVMTGLIGGVKGIFQFGGIGAIIGFIFYTIGWKIVGLSILIVMIIFGWHSCYSSDYNEEKNKLRKYYSFNENYHFIYNKFL